MTERRCEGCRWWRYDVQYHGKPHGFCRRNPPVGGEFPEASADGMCGEWQDASITPEQHERRELIRQFAVAIVAGDNRAFSCEPTFVWQLAEQYVDAEEQA